MDGKEDISGEAEREKFADEGWEEHIFLASKAADFPSSAGQVRQWPMP